MPPLPDWQRLTCGKALTGTDSIYMNSQPILYALDLFGVGVFAVSGALAARRKHMDVFGILVLAFVTALGGGTLRDLLLDAGPVFWISDPAYLTMVAVCGLLTAFSARLFAFPGRWLLVSDAMGLAVFTMLGTKKALLTSSSMGVGLIMGMTTGVAGGVIRDILSAEVPLILRKEIYATAAFSGAMVYLLMVRADVAHTLCALFSILTTLGIRLAAIHWGLTLPIPAPADES